MDTPIFREDNRDGVPMLPLRSLAAFLAVLLPAVKKDMASGAGHCDHFKMQDPPGDLLACLVEFALWGEALNVQLGAADECIYAGKRPAASRYATPTPEVRIIVQNLARVAGRFCGLMRQWCELAEANADALDTAARMVAYGKAVATDCNGVTIVRQTEAEG